MRLLICTTDTDPCPTGQQVWTTTGEVIDPVEFGITSSSVLYVYSWGFAAIFGMWLLGYGVALAIQTIRKL